MILRLKCSLIIILSTWISLQSQTQKPVKSVPAADKAIALTFDDGLEPDIHQQMLDILEKEDVKVTFFLIGDKVTNKKMVKQTLKAGHEIGNHSMSHPVLPQLDSIEMAKEIVEFQQLMQSKFGYTPKVFRAPKLKYNETVMKVLNQESLIPINATVGTQDFADSTSVRYIVSTATSSPKLGDGSIILMHEMQKTTVALPEIIAYYKKKGYRFVTVSEMLSHYTKAE